MYLYRTLSPVSSLYRGYVLSNDSQCIHTFCLEAVSFFFLLSRLKNKLEVTCAHVESSLDVELNIVRIKCSRTRVSCSPRIA